MIARSRRPVQNRPEIEEYIASRPPVEMNMARQIVSRIVYVGPVMIGVFAVFKGLDGAIAAAVGVAIVTAYYLFTGWILSVTARISLATYYAGALFGFLVRLILIGVTMAVLTNQFDLDRVALGVTVAASYVALLMWEAHRLGKPGRKRTSDREISGRRRMGDKSGV